MLVLFWYLQRKRFLFSMFLPCLSCDNNRQIWTGGQLVDLLLPTLAPRLARALHRAARAAISVFTLKHGVDTHGDV